jgi:CheY-like chemotaxis protein
LDFPMANGDAYYLLSRLRTTPATDGIPIFVMSAHRLDALTVINLKREVSGRLGAMQFFTKSADTDELFTALQKFCAFTHNPNPAEDIRALPEGDRAPSE